MDDLEEIWGPRGRATVDPGSVRPAASLPPPPRSQPAFAAAGPGEVVPAGAPTARPPHLPAIVAGTVAAVLVLVAVVVAARPSERPAPPVTAAATATTIVSAAADLLGRSQTKATTDATTTSVETPATTATPTTAVTRTAPASTAGLPPLAQAEDAAQQFIVILHRRDCDALWSTLSRGTQAFLTGSAEPGEPSGRDALCDGLRSGEAIPPMRVHGPAEWRGAGAVVALESEGEVEELAFVAEDGRWLIDLFGDFDEES